MRLNRFFTERLNIAEGSNVVLPESEGDHIRKTLRMSKGDRIILFNGEKEFLAELKIVSKNVVRAEVLEMIREADFSYEDEVEITLFQGLLRAGKMDLILRKTVELGIDKIVPVENEYSITKAQKANLKIDRWKKIILAACKQSERIRVPDIAMPIKFKELEDIVPAFDKFYLFTSQSENLPEGIKVKPLSKKIDKKMRNIAYFIGPEGGLSPFEHEKANSWGIDFVSLGRNVLTSENAAISALAVLEFLYNA